MKLEPDGSRIHEEMEHHLRELCAQLERERQRMLQTGRAREAHLALELPRALMRYPWELMQLPPAVPGGRRELLAERFAVGRQMWTDRDVRPIRRPGSIRTLIVAAPRTAAAVALPGAIAEGRRVQESCAQLSRELRGEFEFACDASIDQTMTRTAFRQLLRAGGYDVLHFAGHGKFDENQPDNSGWLLSDGLLTVTELRNTLAACEVPPAVIYANACSIARFSEAPRHLRAAVTSTPW